MGVMSESFKKPDGSSELSPKGLLAGGGGAKKGNQPRGVKTPQLFLG